jgi:DNA polymerase Ligase (LigD)
VPRFVVLEHDWPEPHLDLFLEAGDLLLAWRLPADYSLETASIIWPNTPHRRHYLDYEGVVSGGRGRVIRWDSGEFDWHEHLRTARFCGRKLAGLFTWQQDAIGNWTFQCVT